jgi:hypothetical protein
MTHAQGGYPAPPGGSQQPSTPQVAKQEAADVGRTAADSGQQVAQTVGEQAKRVAAESSKQARDLMAEGRQQLTQQARDGQRKAASGLHTLADQLEEMHANSDGSGLGPEVIKQAAGHARNVASWLDDREPGDLLNEVRGFARRKPGVFLAAAALAGVAVGRLTRGVVAAHSDDSADGQSAHQPESPSFQAATPVADPVTAPQGYPAAAPQQVQPGYAVPPAPAYSQPPPQPVAGYAPPPGQGRVQP